MTSFNSKTEDIKRAAPGLKRSVRTKTFEAREARARQKLAIKTHFQSTLSCARIRLGVLWWWQVRNTVSNIRADIASQRAELSFLERKLIRYHLTFIEKRRGGTLVSPATELCDPPSASGALQPAADSGSDTTSVSDGLASTSSLVNQGTTLSST